MGNADTGDVKSPPFEGGEPSFVDQPQSVLEETVSRPASYGREAHTGSPESPVSGGPSDRENPSGIERIGWQLGRWTSPSRIGCLIVMLVLVVLIALAARDVSYFFGNSKDWGIVRPDVTSAPASDCSLILLGTSSAGVIYFYDSPSGVFYRESAATSRSIATLPVFEAFHWSPQRDKIAFVVNDRNDSLPLLYVLGLAHPPTDGQLTLVTKRDADGFPSEFGLRADSPLAWSQDGQYIAFVAYSKGGKAALFVSEVATGSVRRLTEGADPVTSVAWETYKNDRNMDDERIVYVLVKDGRELTYSVEKNGAENNPWRH